MNGGPVRLHIQFSSRRAHPSLFEALNALVGPSVFELVQADFQQHTAMATSRYIMAEQQKWSNTAVLHISLLHVEQCSRHGLKHGTGFHCGSQQTMAYKADHDEFCRTREAARLPP